MLIYMNTLFAIVGASIALGMLITSIIWLLVVEFRKEE